MGVGFRFLLVIADSPGESGALSPHSACFTLLGAVRPAGRQSAGSRPGISYFSHEKDEKAFSWDFAPDLILTSSIPPPLPLFPSSGRRA
ncbi:uncharacterized protein BO66DRAFT_395796 [Aspergillus aculeatinus CBS 121060]|uniref:Uncharacterized protein n=1 Tax=Aspergillus aculeatinus CBS 121060 TaxID=1448322 RepID=A0ACD1GUL4_9EURO|nr:hypothetical protein BO66DRAFT_395796 [Aspergillus aculeatinus CBS 121060]RAH65048.1 hypothetical protein BO66DRAFT_395796 [Aspergillus aculeatinus CBS 121060]